METLDLIHKVCVKVLNLFVVYKHIENFLRLFL